MEIVTVHAAKTHLSRLLARVEAGEEIVIARGAVPVARLVPVVQPAAPVVQGRFGALKGILLVEGDLLEPLPDEELDAWEGK
ncbi:MAG: type II toxin-antitoxin system prevent-host-death family antitoxin [Myxococcales bacterium]|nr:type II toxin-antitoxin system prevent-host-death family antitoxin [Myxococcales bacterium]